MECSWCDNDADNDGKSESSLVATGSEHGSTDNGQRLVYIMYKYYYIIFVYK